MDKIEKNIIGYAVIDTKYPIDIYSMALRATIYETLDQALENAKFLNGSKVGKVEIIDIKNG